MMKDPDLVIAKSTVRHCDLLMLLEHFVFIFGFNAFIVLPMKVAIYTAWFQRDLGKT